MVWIDDVFIVMLIERYKEFEKVKFKVILVWKSKMMLLLNMLILNFKDRWVYIVLLFLD